MIEDNLMERYELTFARIAQIQQDKSITDEAFADYFRQTASFMMQIKNISEQIGAGVLDKMSLKELQHQNAVLYEDVIAVNYDTSYANPDYACARLGLDYGRLLSFLYVEIRGIIVYAYEQNITRMVPLAELFVEVYCAFTDAVQDEQELPPYESVKDIIYWYISDYSDDAIERRTEEMLLPEYNFATKIIMESDLSDIRYLYRFGEYITENEIQTAQYLNGCSQEAIEQMARTFTEGYRIGFVLGNKDLSKKKTVNIRYSIGFERLVREEIRQFEQMGLKPTIYRAAIDSINKRMHIKIGYFSTSPNKQMEYDHRFDNALYLDAAFIQRKLGALKLAYEKNKEMAAVFAGPAVMEIFGETPFEPVDKQTSLHLDEKQQKLSVKYSRESTEIINTYIKGEERSFTIIAYPIPEIGKDYEKIFDETVRINTLDYEQYKVIQQNIIDALDGAEYVQVLGTNGNTTDMRVQIMPIEDTKTQTVFENCLADVNIPLGEVFTSPVLTGTTGRLNVSQVYLNDLKFKNLTVEFQDGKVTNYICENFDDIEKNKAFFKENVLYNHDTLPLGEFAIGTNTTAYVMANKYDIVYKLPILIVEKMGPHFAIGDTCYSHSEDVKVYNPNGKEIISRDNEVSILRKTEPDKAYFGCHTDITIPYDEIGSITAVHPDGTRITIIENGRFVLEGCEALNEPFEAE